MIQPLIPSEQVMRQIGVKEDINLEMLVTDNKDQPDTNMPTGQSTADGTRQTSTEGMNTKMVNTSKDSVRQGSINLFNACEGNYMPQVKNGQLDLSVLVAGVDKAGVDIDIYDEDGNGSENDVDPVLVAKK